VMTLSQLLSSDDWSLTRVAGAEGTRISFTP
jgi:hypothetical protein